MNKTRLLFNKTVVFVIRERSGFQLIEGVVPGTVVTNYKKGEEVVSEALLIY